LSQAIHSCPLQYA